MENPILFDNENCRITGSLYIINNPKWPPRIGSFIVTEHKDHKNNLFVGKVVDILENNTIALIQLINNKSYHEKYPLNKNLSGHMILIPSNPWKYVNKTKFMKIFEGSKCCESIIGPKVQTDLTTEAIYESFGSDKNEQIDEYGEYIDPSFFTLKGSEKINELFSEKKINQQLFNPNESFTSPSSQVKQALMSKLNLNETISISEAKLIVSKNASVNNLIESKDDEMNQGRQIVQWIKENLSEIFPDLKMSIFNGYVHITRKGIKVDDVVTKQLIPNLEHFKWQYGLPIDYDTLKYLLFQNEFQNKLSQNIEEQKEAEQIFSQEYLIALQPKPTYHIWTLKRLLMAWYADDQLQNQIRKIKIIINQWRCKSDQEFNQKYGVLPSIVIYPRYGKDSAKNVLKRIVNYFLVYQSIGWNIAKPSYFVKVSDLIWYTNGNLDLKLYFRKSLQSYKGNVINRSFDTYFTRLLSAERLIYPF